MGINQSTLGLGLVRSAIRDLYEYGLQRKNEIGADKVYDFSLGNPSVEPPKEFADAIHELLEKEDQVLLHGYTSSAGNAQVKDRVAHFIRTKFGVNGIDGSCIYMTCGATAALCVSMYAMCTEGDEFIVIAPYFPEYKVFIRTVGGNMVVVPPDYKNFQIDLEAFEKAITPHTKGVILNSPNNPTGVVISREVMTKAFDILRAKEKEYGHAIYVISDEPYRDLVYDGQEVPYIMNEYQNSLVCFSFSKSLSIPGERIGYVAVNPHAKDRQSLCASINGAGRAYGYVCAPSLMQQAVSRCLGVTSDINIYKRNRDILYKALTEYGFECIYPDGAFYLFIKTPEPDSISFSEKAKEHELLLVPSDSFGVTGYVRLAYCVQTEMVERSLPAFKALAEEYNLGQ